jgi:hypothetical protein
VRRAVERGNPIIGVASTAARSHRARVGPEDGYDVEGTATELDADPPRLQR